LLICVAPLVAASGVAGCDVYNDISAPHTSPASITCEVISYGIKILLIIDHC
jgi:hypothetical protein